jgi:glycosyltransferase involved in cell wall biosynthesis
VGELRIAITGGREAFLPRARWVLEELVGALGHQARFVSGEADLVYAPTRPESGTWVPLDITAQDFLLDGSAFPPGEETHTAAGLTLLFPPVDEFAPIPGDVIASSFYLLARIDEHRVAARDRFGRLPFSESAFGRISGLDVEDPPIEGYLGRLRSELGVDEPSGWTVFLTHDIDRIRRRTPKGIAGLLKRRGPRGVASLLAHDPWDNLVDLLWTSGRRGLAPTVFLIGRNQHPLDGTPRRTYERERGRLAAAVRAAGGEVGLHAAFASSESGEALAAEADGLRAEAGPIAGCRFHYLRFGYHTSVPWLERAGLEYDASLGFSERPGYAAGIARPFRPYVLAEERPANLRLVPLAVMDTTLHSHLGLDADSARDRALDVLDACRRSGGAAALLWHNTYLADERAPGYRSTWEELLDELALRGAAMGPIAPPPAPEGADVSGRRIVHLTSVHRPRDVRIFHKEARALAGAGATALVGAPSASIPRKRRLAAGWRLAMHAADIEADAFHVHDPELIPPALWLAARTRVPVVYDAHEYLGETVRTKRWIPRLARVPIALIAERAEALGGRALSGVVAVNPDLAARFARRGARTTSVANSPWAAAYPPPDPPSGSGVVYIGGIGPLRGIGLMLDAFPLVQPSDATLLLVGPGEPGHLPPRVEAVGPIDHEAVPSVLANSRIAWIPLQRHGNYDRAVPTKLVEAMAAGRPVVASNLGRMSAVVRESGCGLLVPPDDPVAHAAALTELLEDDAQAHERGAAGRHAFESGLSFEREAKALTSFYVDVLGDSR